MAEQTQRVHPKNNLKIFNNIIGHTVQYYILNFYSRILKSNFELTVFAGLCVFNFVRSIYSVAMAAQSERSNHKIHSDEKQIDVSRREEIKSFWDVGCND